MAVGQMYKNAISQAFQGGIDFINDDIKLMLLTEGYVPDMVNHKVLADVVGSETVGTGYTAGGKTISNRTISIIDNTVYFDGDDVEWLESTIDARYAVMYDNTQLNKPLLLCLDFGKTKTSTDNIMKIKFGDTGIFGIG